MNTFTIFVLVSSVLNTSLSLTAQSAICFIAVQLPSETMKFAEQLAQNITSIDVFIAIDDNTINTHEISSSTVKILQFDETVCTKYGFQESNVFGSGKTCTAWDKALYYFSHQNIQHSFVWFIEEDVFIPSTQAFLSLHELYSSSYDLVTADIKYNLHAYLDGFMHWHLAYDKFVLPWARGMVCAVGCSRRLLSSINELVQWRGQLAFIEILFHTLAIQDHRMKIVTPFELNTIVYRDTYSFEQIEARPNNWWHPMKDLEQQEEWRNRLAKNVTVNKNTFITTLTSIENQMNSHKIRMSDYLIQNQLLDLLDEFEIVKGQFEPSIRHQLRERFLQLPINRFPKLRSIIGLLADHAFRLPRPIVDIKLRQDKTAVHTRLEKDLENNKQLILELMKNDHPTRDEMQRISLLRDETKQLLYEIMHEIKCIQQSISCTHTKALYGLYSKINQYSRGISTTNMFLMSIIVLCAILICFKLRNKIGRI